MGQQQSLTVGKTYLVPEISAVTKGYCPGSSYNSTNAGPYYLTYYGMLSVTVEAPPRGDPHGIYGIVQSTSPVTSGVTICPYGDTSCSSSFGSTSPTGVELYQ